MLKKSPAIRENEHLHWIKVHFELIFITCAFIIITLVITQTEITVVDLAVQTFVLRMLHSLVILFIVIEFFRSAGFIDNKRLSSLMWTATRWLFVYFVARIISGILDSWMAYSIGWLSNNVQLAFWIVLYLKARKARIILGSNKNHHQRIILRQTFDDLLNRMEEAKRNTERILENSNG